MISLPGLSKDLNLLSPLVSKEILKRIASITAPPSRNNAKKTDAILFNGVVNESGFIISTNSAYPQYFIPFINAKLIEGDNETLVKIKLQLFRGATIFILLWTFICLLTILYSIFISRPIWAITASLIIVTNYLIAQQNFQMHCQKSIDTLKRHLDIQ